MGPEDRKLLEDTFHVAEENNNILREMQRAQKLARLMTIIYWVFIIGSAVGAYYIIQPYVDQLVGAYTGAADTLRSLQTPGS